MGSHLTVARFVSLAEGQRLQVVLQGEDGIRGAQVGRLDEESRKRVAGLEAPHRRRVEQGQRPRHLHEHPGDLLGHPVLEADAAPELPAADTMPQHDPEGAARRRPPHGARRAPQVDRGHPSALRRLSAETHKQKPSRICKHATHCRKRNVSGGAFDSAKNHKPQRRNRQSVTAKREKSQTSKFL